MSRRRAFLLHIAVLTAAAHTALRALPVPAEPIPVPRLVANLTERVSASPDDVQALFTLGRVHYFAFTGATDTVQTVSGIADFPTPYDFIGPPGKGSYARGKSTRALTTAERVLHLKSALTHLQRAVAMKKPGSVPDDGRYPLCLACALEEGAEFAAAVGPFEGLAPDRQAWLDAAIRNYWDAFEKAATKDAALTHARSSACPRS